MADNIIKRALNRLANKTIIPNAENLNTDQWDVLGSLKDWLLGKAGAFKKYTKAYGENPLVYMVVNKIAKSSASIKRVSILEDGSAVDESTILDILKNPNPEDDEIEFKTKINEYLLLTGNSFIHMVRGVGAGMELNVLVSQNVSIVCNKIGDIIRYDFVMFDGTTIPYSPEDILHIKTSNVVNVNGTASKYGLSPLQAAWIIVQSSMEKLKADAAIFKSRGIIGVLSSDSDTPMLDPERKRLQDGFDNDTAGANKYNSIHITSSKLRFMQTGMSPTDLKLLEGILSSLRSICGIYGMPSVLFNDMGSSTYNNVAEAKTTAFTDVYIPLANKVDKELTRFLNKALGQNETITIDLKSIDVLKASTNEVAQALANVPLSVANRAIETMSKDEVRDHILGLESIGVEGKELLGKTNNTKDSKDGEESK